MLLATMRENRGPCDRVDVMSSRAGHRARAERERVGFGASRRPARSYRGGARDVREKKVTRRAPAWARAEVVKPCNERVRPPTAGPARERVRSPPPRRSAGYEHVRIR